MKIFNFKNLMLGILIGLIASLILPNIANARSARDHECNRIAVESNFALGTAPTSIQYHVAGRGQAVPGGLWTSCGSRCDNAYHTESLDYWKASRQYIE